jgi:hypothetical protein
VKVEPVTKEVAEAALPETFDEVEGEELTEEEAKVAAELLMQAMKDHPYVHYFRIVA